MELLIPVPFGVVKVGPGDLQRIRRHRRPLFGGPCLLISRQWGRALDATQDAAPGSQPLMWSTHGLAWQHWLLRRNRRGLVTITSKTSGLELAAQDVEEWSPVVFRRPRASDLHLWELLPTDDDCAFLIRNVASGKALDATQTPEDRRKPHMWEPHWAPWQQWVIARLPLAS